MKWDLAQLYSQLDLQPDCTLEEFKRTYRRRIAELHPDKGAGAGPSEVRLLPELIWLYMTATRFHRRYGRLPGAVPPMRDPGSGSQGAMPQQASADATIVPPAAIDSRPSSQDVPGKPPRRSMVVLLVLLLVLILSWGWFMPPPNKQPTLGIGRIQPPDMVVAAIPDRLKLGMDEATVLAIEGQPFLISDDRWDYGPSWLKFEKGRLVDWHSSPLHQLRTDAPSPALEPANGPP